MLPRPPRSPLFPYTTLFRSNGAFVSLLDPPAELAALAQSCVNTHAFPVLAGPPGSRDVMLSSPIILYDYPAVAPEDRKSTRLNSSHGYISYAVFCLKKKKTK